MDTFLYSLSVPGSSLLLTGSPMGRFSSSDPSTSEKRNCGVFGSTAFFGCGLGGWMGSAEYRDLRPQHATRPAGITV